MRIVPAIKYVLPPVLIDIWRRMRSPHKAGFLWEGIYAGFGEVPSAGMGYEGDAWTLSRAELTRRELEKFRGAKGSAVTPFGSRYALLPFLVSLLAARQRDICVVDFGGAMGYAYIPVHAGVKSPCTIDYHVVDNERSCLVGKSIFEGISGIHFHTDLQDVGTKIDIIFVSGVLQYIDEYRATLRALASRNAAFILFTFLAAGDQPTFATAQVNLKDSVLPAWFFNAGEITNLMAAEGYELAFRAEGEETLDMANFPFRYRLDHMVHMLFAKISASSWQS